MILNYIKYPNIKPGFSLIDDTELCLILYEYANGAGNAYLQ